MDLDIHRNIVYIRTKDMIPQNAQKIKRAGERSVFLFEERDVPDCGLAPVSPSCVSGHRPGEGGFAGLRDRWLSKLSGARL